MTWLVWIIIVISILFVWFVVGLFTWLMFVKIMKLMNRAIEEAWDEPIYIHINIEEQDESEESS